VGGDIIMYSNLISNPSIHHVIPCGVLTEFSCKWGGEAITFLSAYRPVLNPEPGSLRSGGESILNSELESKFWEHICDYSNRASVFLCGDFNLSPSNLDKKIDELDLFARRIPFTGDHYSFRRWDSSRNVLQRSALDHLVWNGSNIPSCHLTQDGFFATDHIPVIIDTKLVSSNYKTRITKLIRNPTLKFSDKGACRRYISRINKQADKLFGDSLPLPSLQTLTDTSVEIVNNIHKRRNSALSPSLWSPIASLLSLR
jgi:hypothetical protein